MQISTANSCGICNSSVSKLYAKSSSKNKYFNTLCDKYPDVNMNMTNSYLFSNNGTTTLNVSPKYIEKSLKDPKSAENLDRLVGLTQSFPQYLSTHNCLPSGTQVSKVSFLVDEAGGVSCQCEFKKNNLNESKQTNDTDSIDYFDQLKINIEKQLEEEQAENRMQKHQQKYRSYFEMHSNPESIYINYFK